MLLSFYEFKDATKILKIFNKDTNLIYKISMKAYIQNQNKSTKKKKNNNTKKNIEQKLLEN